MTATLLGSDAKNSGTSGGLLSQGLVFPAGVTAGDRAFVVAADLNADAMSMPAAWTPGTQQAVGSAGMRLFRKVCDGSESGSTVSFTLPGPTGTRLAGVLFVVHGADAPTENLALNNSVNTLAVPTVKPTVDGCLIVTVAGLRYGTAAGANVTPPSGWSEDKDTVTTNATGGGVGAWLGHRTLGAGTAGVDSPAGSLGLSNTGGGAVWTFAFPPASGGTPPPDPIPAGVVELRLFGPA